MRTITYVGEIDGLGLRYQQMVCAMSATDAQRVQYGARRILLAMQSLFALRVHAITYAADIAHWASNVWRMENADTGCHGGSSRSA